MRRFSFTLKAHPTELLKAVNGLEKKRRDWKEESPAFQGFIQELPKIPKDKIKKMKLRTSAQELLPYALIEPNLEPTILNALFLLIESKCTQFSVRARSRVFAFGLLYPQIRKIGYKHFQSNPPSENEPTWIRLFWKRIFRPEDPIESLVAIASEDQIPITKLTAWFELNPYVHWIDAFVSKYHEKHQNDWLRNCEFEEVYRFIRSSAPLSVRSSILAWVLDAYVQDWPSWDEVPEAYRMLIHTGIELWGIPNRSYWDNCSQRVCTIGSWA